MKKIILPLIVFVWGPLAYAQGIPSLPARCEAFQPSIISKNLLLKESEVDKLCVTNWGQSEKISQKKYWVVYSDRDGNKAYSKPGASAVCGTLKFNEKLYIAKIQNNYALVYSEPKIGEKYPKISSEAVCRGWVPMSKLLLWESCLTNDRGIYNKALLCINLENVNAQTRAIGKGYMNPEDRSQSTPLKTDMNFYYIMKRENDMALLATQYRVDGSLTDKVLYCWVPDESYVAWNQRSCAEPTWDHDDVKYFSDKNIQIKVHKDKSLSGEPISSIGFKWNNSERYDKYEYRMDPYNLRFPILDNGNNAIYNISTFSTIGGSSTVGGHQKKSNAQMIDENRFEELKKMQKINLGIVIDGTSSMEPYYPAVKEAIKEGCKYFKDEYNIKVGIVIYRDYSDGEQGLVEVLPMSNPKNNANLDRFLDTGGAYGIKSSPNDRTNTEALYYGINTALTKLQFKEGQSNILLVVGDCGNAASDNKAPTSEALVGMLAEKDIHLMGFQVRNRNQIDWNSFNNQLQNMMRGSLQLKYDKKVKGVKINGKQSVNESRQLVGYDFKATNVDMDLYICNHRFADPGVNDGAMEVATLASHIEHSIGSFAATIQSQIDMIAQKSAAEIESKLREVEGFAGGNVSSVGLIKVSDAFLKEKFDGIGINLKTAKNTVINFKGYSKKVDGSERKYFKPVLFISNEEFQELLKRLLPVYEAALTKSNDREPYINAMKALVRSLAPGLSDSEMSNMGNGDIMNMIAGLNEAAAALNEYSLNDLSNQAVVSPSQYLRILTDFTRSYKNLKNIKDSRSYKFIKEFNGAKYYWIPIEDLP